MIKARLPQDWSRPAPENDFDEKHIGFIDEHGWALLAVFDPDGNEPDFLYTSGIVETLGAPELIVFGLSFDTMKWIANAYGTRLRDGETIHVDTNHDGFLNNYPVRFLDVDTTNKEVYGQYLAWTHWYYRRHQFPVRQLVWPDSNGKFPWESGCQPGTINAQPLLGKLKS